MYKALFSLAYYGLLRVGELTTGNHSVKAKDVHIGQNKDKMLFVLYTSKTHGLGSVPQEIKISANASLKDRIQKKLLFCPFQLSREYLAIRGNYQSDTEPFFVFKNKEPVTPSHACLTLRKMLLDIGKAM